MSEKERLENMSPIGFDLNGNVLLKSEDYHWLMEQAERVQELEQVIGDLDENVAAFETLWLEEKRKNQRYKQALEFYADEKNYCEMIDPSGVLTVIEEDNGEKARQALESDEN